MKCPDCKDGYNSLTVAVTSRGRTYESRKAYPCVTCGGTGEIVAPPDMATMEYEARWDYNGGEDE